MDTVCKSSIKIEKTASFAAGIIIVLLSLITQDLLISAKDFGIGSYTGVSPTLNYIINEQNKKEGDFNREIANKYFGENITKVERGVNHIKMIRFYDNRPVKINVIELSTEVNTNLSVEPAIASETLLGRSVISNIAKRENAIVAINGGYFKPETGAPLGTLMIDKKIYTGPIYDRVALGIFDDGYKISRMSLNANVNTNIGGFKIDNINQPRMLSTHTIVYTRAWGETSPPTPKYGTQLVIDNGKFVKVSQKSTKIPANGFVVVGPKTNLEKFKNAKNYKLEIKLSPNWKNVSHIISGGPYLVKNGEIYVDTNAQRLTAIEGRNPRTAIGYTKDNNLILLTADGREGASIGLTLTELARLMKELGCVYAMNLDGGGSTVMYVKGKIVNRPAVSSGIPLSHTLTVTLKDL